MHKKNGVLKCNEELVNLTDHELRKTNGGSVVAKILWVIGRVVHAMGDVTVSNDVQYNHVGRGR